jgi:predicted RND superfamily exporter protein
MKEKIAKIILDVQNDISEYLKSDVPLECHEADIDQKMEVMKKEILDLLEG